MDVDSRRAPPSGWTGGQFSVWRATLGIVLALRLGALAIRDGRPVWWVAVAACVLLAAGVCERWIAAALALAAAYFAVRGHDGELADAAFWIAPLCLVALAPGAPYGSWTARGRVDVAGGWTLPVWLARASWIAWGAAHAIWICVHAWNALQPHPPVDPRQASIAIAPVLELLLTLPILLAFAPGFLPAAWTLAFAMDLVLAISCWVETGWSVWVAILWIDLACFVPAWIRPRAAAATEHLFYDGDCGMCHRAVRFVLAEDRTGSAFRFAPLAGPTFARTVPAPERARLPDSIVVRAADGRLIVRSRATLYTLERLGGLWRALAIAARLAPRPLADGLYDLVARVRKRIFAAPGASCPLLPAELARRFDA